MTMKKTAGSKIHAAAGSPDTAAAELQIRPTRQTNAITPRALRLVAYSGTSVK